MYEGRKRGNTIRWGAAPLPGIPWRGIRAPGTPPLSGAAPRRPAGGGEPGGAGAAAAPPAGGPRRPAGVSARIAASSPPTPRITGASAPRMRVELARSAVAITPGPIAVAATPSAAEVIAGWG